MSNSLPLQRPPLAKSTETALAECKGRARSTLRPDLPTVRRTHGFPVLRKGRFSDDEKTILMGSGSKLIQIVARAKHSLIRRCNTRWKKQGRNQWKMLLPYHWESIAMDNAPYLLPRLLRLSRRHGPRKIDLNYRSLTIYRSFTHAHSAARVGKFREDSTFSSLTFFIVNRRK